MARVDVVARARLQIELFGTPRFSYDTLAWRLQAPARAVALIAFLIKEGSPQPRERVAFALWPDEPESDARANLRRHVALVNAALPPSESPWIAGDKKTIAWHGLASVDVTSFRNSKSVDSLDLYTGDFLSGFEDQWILDERDALRATFLERAYDFAIAARRDGDARGALAIVTRMLQVDPWREDALREAIGIRQLLGDRAGAAAQFLDFAKRLREDAGVSPMPETVALYERGIADGESADHRLGTAAIAHPTNLMHDVTSFVGRARECEELASMVLREPLTTLVGTGGVGKTRLATRVARTLLPEFADGVWFVDLAPLDDARLVVPTIAATLREIGTGISTLADLTSALEHRRLLLVLDNCEHLIEACARICARIAATSAHTHILATSRQMLSVDAEKCFSLAPFETPTPAGRAAPDIDALSHNDGVRLFLDRAKAVSPVSLESSSARAALADIARRLDGLPLAIELAASRVRLLSLEQISAGIEKRMRLLRREQHDVPERQKSLHALIDWSYRLLDERDARLFRFFGVFRGTFSVEAAAQLTADDPLESLDALGALVERSLVAEAETTGGKKRFRLLENLRSFAHEQLLIADEREEAEKNLTAFVVQFATDIAPRFDSDIDEALASCHAEMDNIRAVFDARSRGSDDTFALSKILDALGRFFVLSGRYSEGLHLFAVAEAERDLLPSDLQGRLLATHAIIFINAGDFAAAIDRLRTSVQIARASGDSFEEARRSNNLASAMYNLGNHDEAGAIWLQTLRLFERIDSPRGKAAVLQNLALLTFEYRDDPATARTYLRDALDCARSIDDRERIANLLGNLAEIDVAAGDADAAIVSATESLRLWRSIDNESYVAQQLRVLATAHLARGDLSSARESLTLALKAFLLLKENAEIGDSLINAAELQLLAGRIDTAAAILPYAKRLRASDKRAMTRRQNVYVGDLERRIAAALSAVPAFNPFDAMTLERVVEAALEP